MCSFLVFGLFCLPLGIDSPEAEALARYDSRIHDLHQGSYQRAGQLRQELLNELIAIGEAERLRGNDEHLRSVLRVIEQVKKVNATPQEMVSRLDGRNYRWHNGPSIFNFTVTDGKLHGRLNRDEPWLLVPSGTNTLRRYGPNGEFAEFVFTNDLQAFLFNAGDGGIRTGTRVDD